MACDFEVCFNAGQYEADTATALKALDLVEELEDQMSVFRETSEISSINRTAANESVPVEPGLFGLLELAVQLYDETGGALDMTSAPLWKAWGFARRAGGIPSEEELAAALECVGSDLVQLNGAEKSIRFLKPGVELNLGSIGKGHALDQAAEVLVAEGIEDFLIHGGHSSVLARGSRMEAASAAAVDASASGWVVGLQHPLRRGVRLVEIRLRDRALATSSSGVQYFRHQGKRYGHVLDPRTGWPAEGVLSATALAPTAAVADALSTAFYVMGADAVRQYCQARPELAAILICPAVRGPGVEVVTVGLAEAEFQPTADW
jgi:thiamine biosynthesis lipoprotein